MPWRVEAHAQFSGVKAVTNGQYQLCCEGDSYSERVPQALAVRFVSVF